MSSSPTSPHSPTKNVWRNRLFGNTFLISASAWFALYYYSPPATRSALLQLGTVYACGFGAILFNYRKRLSERVVTANAAVGAFVHLAFAAVVAVGLYYEPTISQLQIVPAYLRRQWRYILIGAAGCGAAFFSWTHAVAADHEKEAISKSEQTYRQVVSTAAASNTEQPEPPPPAHSAVAQKEPDYAGLAAELRKNKDATRLRQLSALQRIEAILLRFDGGSGKGSVLPAEARLDAAVRAIRQEVQRVASDAMAETREAEEDDVLTQAAQFAEWAASKIPELGQLDISDLVMGKAVADIQNLHNRIENKFIDHRQLQPIHPITRDNASQRCDERAEAFKKALPVLQANNMKLSEAMIQADDALAAFRSVTGFQVVDMGDGFFVTFEGNGRREALKRAFGTEQPVFVECRVFCFDDPETMDLIRKRVRGVQKWKGVLPS